MRKSYLYFILLVIPLACSSPQKSFDKGRYGQAFSSALKNIKKGKKNRKDRTVLNLAFQELYDEKLIDAERYLHSDQLEDWEEAYKEYDDLLEKYYDGKAYLDKDFDPLMEVVQNEKDTLQEDLAKNYHDLGMMSMAGFDEEYHKAYAQDAYLYFTKTRRYDKDFPKINSLIDDAFSKGVIIVLVEADATFELKYSWEIDQQFDNIERQSKDFYEIVYERILTDPDCVLEVDFSRLDVSSNANRTTESFSEQVDDGFETKIDTSGKQTRIKKYKTVEGSVTTVSETLTYSWRMAVNPRGSRDYCDFDQRYFDAQERVVVERYELSGDRQAIPSRYTNSNNESRIDEDDVADDLIRNLYNQFVSYYF